MSFLIRKLNNVRVLKFSKVIIFLLLLFFLGYLVTYKIPLPAAEDLPRQMANGRDILAGNWEVLTQNFYSYTQTNHYFANHHWLYGVFAYVLNLAIGWSGMVILKIIFILATFSLLFWTALRKADFWLVALSSIPTIFMLAGRSALRPELFGYFFTVLFIYLLLRLEDNPKSRLIYWLIPIQILWANLHITFPIGVMIVGCFLIEKLIHISSKSFRDIFSFNNLGNVLKDTLVKKLMVLLLVLVIASFMNPLGIKGVIYSLTANVGTDSPVKSSEVQPIFAPADDTPKWASIPVALVIPVMAVALLSFIAGFRKKQFFYFFVFLGFSVLALFLLRGAPFLGIIFLLAFPTNLNDLFLKGKDWINNRLRIEKLKFDIISNFSLAIFLLCFMTFNYSNFLFGREVGVGLERNALDSANFFINNNIKGPIFNDTDIGSYLSFYLYPKEKIYTDNRFGDAYSDDFFLMDYVNAISSESGWQETLEKYRFNSIFLYQYDQGYNMRDFMFRRIRDKNWTLVYADRFAIILVRNIEENREVIEKYGIHMGNIGDRIKYLTEDYDGYNQVAAADIYALMGEPAWAMSNYAVAVALHPEWAKIWFVMGKMELQRADAVGSNPALALMYLQQAIDRGWKTTNAYSFLALAYYRLGQLDKVEEAVAKELKINPKSEDAELWLKTIEKEKAKRALEYGN